MKYISYDSFSVLVLRKVRENSWNLSIFSLLLEKLNQKNPRRFFYSFEHTKFALILKCNTVPCRIFRGISFENVVMTCARCGKPLQTNVFYLFYRHASFFAFIISKKISATYAFHMCVGYDKTKKPPSNKIWYDIYIRQILYKNTCVYVPFKCEKMRV